MNTMTTFNHQFTSRRGNHVRVFRQHQMGHNGVFSGRRVAVRAWAEVNGSVVEVPAGETFRAPSCVHAAGF